MKRKIKDGEYNHHLEAIKKEWYAKGFFDAERHYRRRFEIKYDKYSLYDMLFGIAIGLIISVFYIIFR